MYPTVSVIIPCFNASAYLEQTLASITGQTYPSTEIIIVNDGSTEDVTLRILSSIQHPSITVYHQSNKGVSVARNYGFLKSSGKYVLFMDADDLMSPDYISVLVQTMEMDSALGVCGGNVYKIDESGKETGVKLSSVETNVAEEILLYNPLISTCPSIYLIRSEILKTNQILFNEKLSSTADKFFLIQLSSKTKFKHTSSVVLYYRVHQSGMSFSLSESLIDDNRLYYYELKKNNLIPAYLKNKSHLYENYMLSGSYYKMKKYLKSIRFGCKALLINPIGFLKLMLK
jgi:glycosyltransferase involved in cell wall biosynthesis